MAEKKSSNGRPILPYDPDLAPKQGEGFAAGFFPAVTEAMKSSAAAMEPELHESEAKKESGASESTEEASVDGPLDHLVDAAEATEVESHEREAKDNLAEKIVHRKAFETFYPMRDVQEEIAELSQPVKLDAIRRLHETRIREIQNDLHERVKEWEDWDAYGAMLVETQSTGQLVDAVPQTTEEEMGHIKESAVTELDRDMDSLYAQVKKVKATDSESLDAPFEEAEMNKQTDHFVKKYGLSREEREHLIGDLAKEFERENVPEVQPKPTVKTDKTQDAGKEVIAWDEKFDEFLNRGNLGVIPPEPDMPGKDVARLEQGEPSDYGFRVQSTPPDVEVVPERKATERGDVITEGSMRQGLRRLGVLFTQGGGSVGGKIGKSMNWIRDTVKEPEGLTKKQIVTRRILGGVALVGVAAAAAFAGYKFAEAGFDVSPDSLPGADTSNGAADFVDVPPETEIESGADSSSVDLPDPESFRDEHPWDWAVESYGEGNAMSELHKLSDKAAEAGHVVEWHGSGTNEWVEIDGNSNTVDVLRILRQYA